MKIVICSSIHFAEKIREIEKGLAGLGHDVVIPHSINEYNVKNHEDDDKLRKITANDHSIKQRFTRRHFNEIKDADAILVVNEEKRGIPNYIGGATLSEIMFAFYFSKKIFLLNPIPTDERLAFFRDEIEGVDPVVINGNLGLIE